MDGAHVRPNTPADFWERVDKSDGCWLWRGGVCSNGYGRFRYRGEYVSAHRFAYADAVGPIPEGAAICHRCDTPLCCRPGHLFPGTTVENQADKVEKRRHARGARHGRAKLDEAAVAAIRERLGAGESARGVALSLGLDPSTVQRIAAGRRWRTQPGGPTP